jgi:hypothetical protein
MSEETIGTYGQAITDIESIPAPRVDFTDMSVQMRDEALNIAKYIYLARDRGDIVTWKECAQALKVRPDGVCLCDVVLLSLTS